MGYIVYSITCVLILLFAVFAVLCMSEVSQLFSILLASLLPQEKLAHFVVLCIHVHVHVCIV